MVAGVATGCKIMDFKLGWRLLVPGCRLVLFTREKRYFSSLVCFVSLSLLFFVESYTSAFVPLCPFLSVIQHHLSLNPNHTKTLAIAKTFLPILCSPLHFQLRHPIPSYQPPSTPPHPWAKPPPPPPSPPTTPPAPTRTSSPPRNTLSSPTRQRNSTTRSTCTCRSQTVPARATMTASDTVFASSSRRWI